MRCWKYNPYRDAVPQAEVCVRVCVQGRGKVFYVGGAVGGGGSISEMQSISAYKYYAK